jgi:hypothetical protein
VITYVPPPPHSKKPARISCRTQEFFDFLVPYFFYWEAANLVGRKGFRLSSMSIFYFFWARASNLGFWIVFYVLNLL